jgi:hypothetical protein
VLHVEIVARVDWRYCPDMADKFRHNALRDTMWLGKGVKLPWLVVAGIVALAFVAARLFGS